MPDIMSSRGGTVRTNPADTGSESGLARSGQDPARFAELAVGRAVARLGGDVFVDDELVVSPSLVVRRTTAQPREA
jgi:hypothetical protein